MGHLLAVGLAVPRDEDRTVGGSDFDASSDAGDVPTSSKDGRESRLI